MATNTDTTMTHQQSQSPPTSVRYARVQIMANLTQLVFDVPINWLQDWRRAIQPMPTDKDATARRFLCFYSPAGHHIQPTFTGLPTFDYWLFSRRTDVLYKVQVLQVMAAQPTAPPNRYARVQLVTDDAEHHVMNVPLAWLQDWRRAVVRNHYSQFLTYWADIEPELFICFYSPLGHHVRPEFRDMPLRDRWPPPTDVGNGNCLYTVYLLSVHRVGDNEYPKRGTVTVRLGQNEEVRLTVPVTQLYFSDEFRTYPNGKPMEPDRLWLVYYDDRAVEKSKKNVWPDHRPTIPRHCLFQKGVKACYLTWVVKFTPAPDSKGNRSRRAELASDEDSLNDNMSTVSLDNGANNGDNGGGDNDSGDYDDRAEEKLLQALENATEKSAQTRTAALASIVELLSHRYVPDCIEDRKVTVMDLIERSLRRGKGAEQQLAAQIVPQLVLQLGDADVVVQALGPLLLQTAQNHAVAVPARARCCAALALCTVLGGSPDVGDVLQLMLSLRGLFAGATKSDKSAGGATAGASAEASILHCAALNAWSLLLTLLPSGDFAMLMNSGAPALPSIKTLIALLDSQHLDVRMAAGECIALVLETGRAYDADFLDEHVPELIEITRRLATDSQKFRAKRDRKTQRASFRDVLRYVENDELPETTVRFGSYGERLELDSWADHALYAALLGATGPGMTSHLACNEFMRDVLGMEAPRRSELEEAVDVKRSRQQRQMVMSAMRKERSMARTCDRNKKGSNFLV